MTKKAPAFGPKGQVVNRNKNEANESMNGGRNNQMDAQAILE